MSPINNSPEERFAGTIKFPTISSSGSFSLEPFHEMREYSISTWPAVFSIMKMEIHGGASILLEWQGRSPDSRPLLLTAHQDVVPAGEDWSFDPFSGEIRGGSILGRGTIDYKCGFAGMLEACEVLIGNGFVPERTVLLAFGHDEEIGGLNGAKVITDSLLQRGVSCSSVLDEGGYVYTDPQGEEKAVIATAEKGYATFQLTSSAVQGHSSVPPERTAIGVLARALCVLEKLQIIDPPCPPEFQGAPFTGTTIAPTVINGGCKENVLPGSATALVNTRPAPLSSVNIVREQIASALQPLNVKVELSMNPSVSEPSGFSRLTTSDYLNLREAVTSVLGDSLPVIPGVFPAATDSRRYKAVAEETYRFMPVHLGAKGLALLHSVDESITVVDYLNCVRFYAEYISRAAGQL